MKRVGGLWPLVTSFENVLEAALDAARGKRKRPDVARFLHNLEPEVHRLRNQLVDGTYEPGAYREVWIRRTSAKHRRGPCDIAGDMTS